MTLCQTAVVALILSSITAQAANAQTTTLRDPLIPGVPTAAPNEMQMTPLPPPPGDGDAPPPVTPGIGSPVLEPWVPAIPSNTIGIGDSSVSLPDPSTTAPPGALGPSISVPPPPSTPGSDPGSIHQNPAGQQPPVAFVPMQQQGGLGSDQAPTSRWNGQTTQDFGRNSGQNNKSANYDFGQKLSQKPDLYQTPQESQDGPRGTVPAQDFNSPHRLPQIPGAQETTDLGQRTLFQGPNLRAKFTIAPY
ncbi:MAG: hypothetical protein ACRD3W_13870 [Terriglobales bacterium]